MTTPEFRDKCLCCGDWLDEHYHRHLTYEELRDTIRRQLSTWFGPTLGIMHEKGLTDHLAGNLAQVLGIRRE